MRRSEPAHLGVSVADPRVLGHDPELALQRQGQADANRKTIDRGDQRLFEIGIAWLAAAAPMKQRIVGVLMRRPQALRLVLGKKFTVESGVESRYGASYDTVLDIWITSES